MTSIALTIAGSDSSGGAGIQADLKTFSALGVYGASVITALTAQNTQRVVAVHRPPADFIIAQMKAVASDLDVRAIKIGMVGGAEAIEAVAAGLSFFKNVPLVLDPVMVAASGDPLLEPGAEAVLKARLLPLATVLTPNLLEAARLLDAPEVEEQRGMAEQAKALQALGPRAVLIKGGHASGAEAVDLLWDGRKMTRFVAPRHATRNTHGTGCTLSSAIAAGLAKGQTLFEAIRGAKAYLTAAIEHADSLAVGSGHGPVHHFHHLWEL